MTTYKTLKDGNEWAFEEDSKVGWRMGEGHYDYYMTDGVTKLYWDGIELWEPMYANEDLFAEWLDFVGEGENDVKQTKL